MDPIVYTYYERLSHNPEDAEALALLWDHHGTRGEFQQLATLAEQVAARRMDPRSGADLFYRAGELWAKNVGRPDKAVACYLKAAELDPSQQLAIGAARDIYVQLGNHRQAAQLLDRQIAATADPLVRGMLLREGMTLRAQAGDIAGQLAYLEEILAMSPNDWEMMREMAGALIARAQTDDAQPDDAPRAAQMLAALAQSMGPELGLPFAEAALDAFAGDETAFAMVSEAYTAAGRQDDLTVRQIAFVTANPGSEYTVGIRRALAEAYLAVGQVDDAINCLEPIVGVDPALQRTLAGLYRQAGRVDELASLFDQLAPTVEPGQRVVDLKELAALYGQQGNRAAMIRAMRDVLAIDPADPDALTLVEDDLRARREYGDLREVLAAAVRAPHCPPDARIPRLREIARLSTDHLKDADAAVDAWREILNSGPADVEALAELDPLLEHGERWDELVMVLEQRAELTEAPELRRTLLGRLADLHRDRRDDPVAEAAVVAMLWEAAPEDDGVAMRLAALRKITGDAAGAVEVLRTRAERATGPEAAGRWAALAEAREQAEDLAGAIEAWREVVSRDNAHPRAWTEIERLLGATRQHAVLFATLTNRAEMMSEGPARAAIHARAADAARAMGDPSTAIAEAERAVAMDPENDALSDSLLDALESAGLRERLLTFVHERSARMPDGTAKMDLYRRAARTVGLIDPSSAAMAWQELRDCAKRAGLGDDSEALEVLMGLAEIKGDHERLVALYLDAARAAPDADGKREILKRRAELLARELGRTSEAVDALRDMARELAREHAETWASLEAMATEAGRFDVAAEAIERQVELAPEEDDARAQHAARLVALVEREVKDPAALLHALEVNAKADPGDLGVIQRLADLSEAQGRAADAVRYLEQLAEIEGDDEELSKLAQRVAHLADESLGDSKKAWETLLPLVRGGDIACLDTMLALATRRGLHADLIPVLTDLASRVGDAEARATLWREVATRRQRFLDDPDGAFEAHVNATVAHPAVIESLAEIDTLALTVKRPQRVAEAYRAAIEACTDPTTGHDLAMRGLGILEVTGARPQAFDLVLAALSRAPADDELLDALVRLVPSPERNEAVYLALDRRKRAVQSDAERFAITLRAAEIAGGHLADANTAFQYLEQALGQAIGRKGDPDDEMLNRVELAARQADRQRPEAGMLSGLVERYARFADDASEDNPRVSAVLLRRAGALCESELALADHAFGLYTRGVALWPADERNAAALERVGEALGRLGEVAATYQRVADEAYEPATARAYAVRRARLLADRLGQTDEAIEAFQRLAEFAPKDLSILRALQGLLEQNERWQALLLALERELDAGGDRAGVYRRVATVWETRLRNTFEAKDNWKRVLKYAPDDPEARAALERLERRAQPVDLGLEDLVDEATPAPVPAPVAPEVTAAPVYATEPTAHEDSDPGPDLFAQEVDAGSIGLPASDLSDTTWHEASGAQDSFPDEVTPPRIDAMPALATSHGATPEPPPEAQIEAPVATPAPSAPSMPPLPPPTRFSQNSGAFGAAAPSKPPPPPAQVESPLDALQELREADELDAEEIHEVLVDADDDAPSLDALAALTTAPTPRGQ